MKKTFRSLIITSALWLAVLPAAFAEEKSVSMSGTIEPECVQMISAPTSGSIVECAETGDRVKAGDTLAVIDTVRVYAPCDGIARGIRAEEGDDLSAVSTAYGGVMYIEPTSRYIIQATTQNAYDANENRMIHVGETVYLTSVNNSERTGVGVVTSVTGENYTVEVTESNIRLNETCRVSRDEDSTETKSRIGQGKTQRNNPVAVTADGSLVKLHVQEGEAVNQGDLLMEIVPDALEADASNELKADQDLIVLSQISGKGSAVQKKQTILQVFPVGTLQAVVQVYEEDLDSIQEGDPVQVKLDVDSERYVYEGTIEKISYVPSESSGGVAYDVTVSFENDDFVRMGMSVTVETEK